MWAKINSSVGAEAGRDQRRRCLRKTHRRLGVHFVMQGRDESCVERIAAAGRVGDIYGVGGHSQPRSVTVSVEGALVAKRQDAARGAAIKIEGRAILGRPLVPTCPSPLRSKA